MHSFSPYKSTYNEIIPNLFVGDYHSTKYAKQFKMIVNCTKHIPFPIVIDIDLIRVSINDSEIETNALLQIAPGVIEKIHSALQRNKPVLVHCHAGMQRSCAIVAMYLMKYYTYGSKRITPEMAIRIIQSKRPIAFQPKPTFDKAMQTYYKQLL